MQETDESINIQDQQTQQDKGKEQAEYVIPTIDNVPAVDRAWKPSLSGEEIIVIAAVQKIEKVEWDKLLFRNSKFEWTQTRMQSHLLTSMFQLPQDKNDDSTNEQHGKYPEEVQKPPLSEGKVEEAVVAETTKRWSYNKKVQRHNKHFSIFLRERTLNYN